MLGNKILSSITITISPGGSKGVWSELELEEQSILSSKRHGLSHPDRF